MLTLFPEMITQGMNTSIIGRAMAGGFLSVNAVNIRDFAFNKHQKVDDYPYGGGAGMLMQAEPVYLAYESIKEQIGYRPRVVYLTPQGTVFHQNMAKELAKEKDLVFLDIEMPGMNGIYIGNELKKANKNVIIFVVTSYSEYLDDAMRFHVFRYLSKPLDRSRFLRNMKDALTYYNSITVKIPVETRQGLYSFPASQIIAIEAQSRKVIVHTVQQDFDSIYTMDYWLNLLPKNSFFQTHRSFIINLDHVVDFDHFTIHLSNPQLTAYLTRRKYSSFKNAYLLYLESMR